MSQYPGGRPPQDSYYGQPPADPYAVPPPQPPSDPYFGQPPGDPYAPPQDPYYGQRPPAEVGQATYYAPSAPPSGMDAPSAERRSRGGAGAAVVGLLLVAVGIWILFGDELALDIGEIWPIAAVALGVLMVIGAFVPRRGRG